MGSHSTKDQLKAFRVRASRDQGLVCMLCWFAAIFLATTTTIALAK